MDSDDDIPSEVEEEELEDNYDDDDAYSVDDFEEESTSPSKPPPRRFSPPKSSMTKVEDSYDGYSQATFEEESQSVSPRHTIKLNSPRRRIGTSISPVKVASKETPPPAPVGKATIQEDVKLTAPLGFREHAVLREVNEKLQQQQFELKGQLKFAQQRHQDELRVRRERLMAKKHRAGDRRWRHEQDLRASKARIVELEAVYKEAQSQSKEWVSERSYSTIYSPLTAPEKCQRQFNDTKRFIGKACGRTGESKYETIRTITKGVL